MRLPTSQKGCHEQGQLRKYPGLVGPSAGICKGGGGIDVGGQ